MIIVLFCMILKNIFKPARLQTLSTHPPTAPRHISSNRGTAWLLDALPESHPFTVWFIKRIEINININHMAQILLEK